MSKQNVATVKKFYEHLAQNEFNLAFELLDPDFQLIQAESLPYGGTYRGKEGVEAFFQKLFAYFERFGSEDVSYFSEGNTVITTSVAVRRTRTGKDFRMPLVQVYHLKAGKLLETRPFYFDTAWFDKYI